jgi:hypothetical protein
MESVKLTRVFPISFIIGQTPDPGWTWLFTMMVNLVTTLMINPAKKATQESDAVAQEEDPTLGQINMEFTPWFVWWSPNTEEAWMPPLFPREDTVFKPTDPDEVTFNAVDSFAEAGEHLKVLFLGKELYPQCSNGGV